MLGFFEGGVLRHDEPPDQPADEPRFVPVIEVIFIRQPHSAVFGVQLPQQLYMARQSRSIRARAPSLVETPVPTSYHAMQRS